MDEVRLSLLEQLEQIEELLLDGSRIPFSGGRLVNEQEAMDVLVALRESLPNQLIEASKIINKLNQISLIFTYLIVNMIK